MLAILHAGVALPIGATSRSLMTGTAAVAWTSLSRMYTRRCAKMHTAVSVDVAGALAAALVASWFLNRSNDKGLGFQRRPADGSSCWI